MRKGPALLADIRALVLALPLSSCVTVTEMPKPSETPKFFTCYMEMRLQEKRGMRLAWGGRVLITPGTSPCVLPSTQRAPNPC